MIDDDGQVPPQPPQQVPLITGYHTPLPPPPPPYQPPSLGAAEPRKRVNGWMISTIVLGLILLLLMPCSCTLLFMAIDDSGDDDAVSPPVSMGTRGPAEGYVGHPLNAPGSPQGASVTSTSSRLPNDDWNLSHGSGTMLSSVIAADYPSWHVDSGTRETRAGKDTGWLLRLESPDHDRIFVDVHYDRVPGTDDWSPSGWSRRGDDVFGGAAGRAVGRELLDRYASDYGIRPVVVSATELRRLDDGTRSFRIAWRAPNAVRDIGSTLYVRSAHGAWSVR